MPETGLFLFNELHVLFSNYRECVCVCVVNRCSHIYISSAIEAEDTIAVYDFQHFVRAQLLIL